MSSLNAKRRAKWYGSIVFEETKICKTNVMRTIDCAVKRVNILVIRSSGRVSTTTGGI